MIMAKKLLPKCVSSKKKMGSHLKILQQRPHISLVYRLMILNKMYSNYNFIQFYFFHKFVLLKKTQYLGVGGFMIKWKRTRRSDKKFSFKSLNVCSINTLFCFLLRSFQNIWFFLPITLSKPRELKSDWLSRKVI